MKEVWDLYTIARKKTGRLLQRGEPIPSGYYHLVISAWIRNSRGEYLLSQRHPDKPYPLYWECTGGSVLAGENSLDGAVREVKEELGIFLDPNSAKLIYQTRRDDTQDFYDVWLFHEDTDIAAIRLQQTEVINAKWVNQRELLDMFLRSELHPLINYIGLVVE